MTTPTTVELAHEVQGEGPLLVLLHGITENRASFDPLVADLARDHRVLRVDLRGHGASPAADGYDLDGYAADLDVLVPEPALVVGHSLGGLVATVFAGRRANGPAAVRGVVNVDQNLDLGGLQAAVQQAGPALRGPEFAGVVAALFDSLRGRVDDAGWDRLSTLRAPDQDVVLGTWSVLLDETPEALAARVDAWCSGVRCAYLALDGVDPGPGHAAWLADRIPQAVLEVWDGDGHYPHLVRPERFLARVRAFEAELPPVG